MFRKMRVRPRSPKKSKFNLSHQFKFTTGMGRLIPVLCQDVVPGDHFTMSSNYVLRFQPLIRPIMHNVDVFLHYFFVPNRIIWDDWETFITGSVDGKYVGYETEIAGIVSPFIQSGTGGFGLHSLADYFGINPTCASLQSSALPFRAYAHIFNDWFRQEDIQDPIEFSTASGQDTTTPTTVLKRNWNRDYFTTCLPYAQKGPPVSISLGERAPVLGLGVNTAVTGNPSVSQTYINSLGTTVVHSGVGAGSVGGSSAGNVFVMDTVTTGAVSATNHPDIYADLSAAQGLSINDLRLAFQIQRYLEKDARCGSRYVEFLLSHFGVRSSDARLQRSEYLGGKRAPVMFSEVLQTSSTDDTSPLANMAGHGFSASGSGVISRFFEEHGWVICLMSIMPRTGYQQGVPRQFTRTSRYDYLNPEFVHLGEQGVLNKELFLGATYSSTDDEQLFGYQSRFEEYRRIPSHVAGDFRTTLTEWHLDRLFTDRPSLNSTFLSSSPSNRIFTVQSPDDNNLLVQLEHVIHAVRPLPKRAVPGLIDHGF